MFHVKEERTLVNPNAGKATYTESGFVVEKDDAADTTTEPTANKEDVVEAKPAATASTTATTATTKPATSAAAAPKAKAPPVAAKAKEPVTTLTKPAAPTAGPVKEEIGAMQTYPEFTERHAETVEQFMACKTLEQSKEFLLKFGDILLCENASNYLLLASLEDEMNGEREKMKLTARQSQIVTNIAELAKTVHTHPGNVIQPFFARLQERKHLEGFITGVNEFVDKIIKRAVVKKAEIDEQRRAEQSATDLEDVPREERLGPGGLDPLEVIETLPASLVEAFESRDTEQLKAALMQMDPEDAEYHMKRCVDSGLWVQNS
jgi:cell division cycle protein 37